jgi:myo-inositol-1(or 4)-monophosphatase
MDLQKIGNETIEVVKQAAAFIKEGRRNFSNNDIQEKSLNSLVSYIDIESEKILVAGLKKIIPNSDFLTEENTTTQSFNSDWLWIIDPLDGTTNFIHQIPAYAVSVALQYKNETVLGIVYEINRDECFHAIKNQGAFLNNKRISVNQNNSLSNSLIATGFPYEKFDYIDKYISILKELMIQSRGVRRLGSAAIDLAYVACGRFDLFFEYNLNPWDIAAGALLVSEASGKVTDFKAGNNYLFGREIVAGNNFLLDEFYKIYSNIK